MHLISALFLSTPSLHLPLHIFSLYLLSSLSSAFPFFTSSVNITSPILHLSISLFPPYLEANETKCPKCSSHLKNPWVWPSEKSLKNFLVGPLLVSVRGLRGGAQRDSERWFLEKKCRGGENVKWDVQRGSWERWCKEEEHRKSVVRLHLVLCC